MAMTDKFNYFNIAKAVTATGDADDVIDLLAIGMLGNGTPMMVVINVDVAADATSGDETYTFAITTDDNPTLSSDTTIATKTIPRSALTLNSIHTIDIPEDVPTERYLGFVHTLGGTTPSITYTAYLAPKGSLTNLYKAPNGWDV